LWKYEVVKSSASMAAAPSASCRALPVNTMYYSRALDITWRSNSIYVLEKLDDVEKYHENYW